MSRGKVQVSLGKEVKERGILKKGFQESLFKEVC